MAREKKSPAARGVKRVRVAKGISLKRGKESELRKKPGSSSVGRYKDVSKEKFCGPSGGAAKGTYPVNSKKRCHAALAYAHNAPKPEGIKKCVRSKCTFKTVDKRGREKKK